MAIVARSAENTADRSSLGSAWPIEPPTVPRLRTIGSAITRSASWKIRKCSPATADSSSSACRVIAPMSRASPSRRTYDSSSASSLMSIRCSGRARRSFIIGSNEWPPATSRASGPSRSSRAMASSTLVARSYPNGAGVCMSWVPYESLPSARTAPPHAEMIPRAVDPVNRTIRVRLSAAPIGVQAVGRDRAEAAGLEVLERLHELGPRVHHERSVRRDRLAQRLATEQEHVEGIVGVGRTVIVSPSANTASWPIVSGCRSGPTAPDPDNP